MMRWWRLALPAAEASLQTDGRVVARYRHRPAGAAEEQVHLLTGKPPLMQRARSCRRSHARSPTAAPSLTGNLGWLVVDGVAALNASDCERFLPTQHALAASRPVLARLCPLGLAAPAKPCERTGERSTSAARLIASASAAAMWLVYLQQSWLSHHHCFRSETHSLSSILFLAYHVPKFGCARARVPEHSSCELASAQRGRVTHRGLSHLLVRCTDVGAIMLRCCG